MKRINREDIEVLNKYGRLENVADTIDEVDIAMAQQLVHCDSFQKGWEYVEVSDSLYEAVYSEVGGYLYSNLERAYRHEDFLLIPHTDIVGVWKHMKGEMRENARHEGQ